MSSDVIKCPERMLIKGKRLRNDAKQCKIVLLRYTKALDNDNVIKCN